MRDYCKAGLNTSNERFILHFLESVDEKEELEFNMVCQKLMTSMLLCLDKAIKHKESNIHSSFWFNINDIWRKKRTIISEAKNSITSNKNLYALFQRALLVQPEIDEEVIRRCYLEVVEKVINASAGTVFKLFHELFIGHYSKKINVEFRKNLQVQAKTRKNKDRVKKKEEDEDN